MTNPTQITINIVAATAAQAREEMAKLLGSVSMNVTVEQKPTVEQAVAAVIAETPELDAAVEEFCTRAEAPKRERGKPAPGRARRTKEEIAEDEAADAAETKAPAAEEKPLISTDEERIDPTTAEDAAQDNADEQAEAEVAAPVELTHDSVRGALSAYVKAFGMEATMTDGAAILSELFGEGKVKVSDIPNTQDDLAAAVAALEAAIANNRFNRTQVV